MKIVSYTEKDQYTYIAIEDLGDGTCRLYEPEDRPLLEQISKMLLVHSSDSSKVPPKKS